MIPACRFHETVVMGMAHKKTVEKELQRIREQIEAVRTDKTADALESLMAKETSTGLVSIIKMVADQNAANTLILKRMSENLVRIEQELSGDYYTQDDRVENPSETDKPSKIIPVSSLDARILQLVQVKGMACADDVQKEMNYSGRNAACARLNKLYTMGLLERHQLGHKVYFKYRESPDAASTLIISPPQ
jgi:hypothetical protein